MRKIEKKSTLTPEVRHLEQKSTKPTIHRTKKAPLPTHTHLLMKTIPKLILLTFSHT